MTSVLWAQRADKIFLTLQVQDCESPDIRLEKGKLFFRGKSDSIQKDADHSIHELTIEFYKSINVDKSKHIILARGIEFVIIKEEPQWWPRLLKDTTKQHWLKVDFLKWKDEDDTDDEQGPGHLGAGQPDFGDLMQQFGSFGGGAGADGDEEFESDDDDTEQSPPDLE